jgi:UDP-N-acetylmuramyl pentapeptide phosphotransferase/UDP-N-acetylglucosamine-1-phosphate transferase
LSLLISILPYVFNSLLILLTVLIFRKRASVSFDGKRLSSDHMRSLVTLITYRRRLTEHQVVAVISMIVLFFTAIAVFVELL